MENNLLQNPTIQYILKCYEDNKEHLSFSAEYQYMECRYMMYALLASLSDEELDELRNYVYGNKKYENINLLILEMLHPSPSKAHYVRPLNTPVKQLIEWYTDKKSKKVQIARREIHHRFLNLDPEDQWHILKLFLEGTLADRMYAYNRYDEHWDATSLDKVLACWEHASNFEEWMRAGLLLIRVAPEELLMSLNDKLYITSDNKPVQTIYKEFCMRLGKKEDFTIDKQYFREPATYYYVLSKLGKIPNKSEFEKDLYKVVILLYAEEYYRIYPALLPHAQYTKGQYFYYPARVEVSKDTYRELHLCEVYDIRRMLSTAITFGYKDIVNEFVLYAQKVDAEVSQIQGTDCIRKNRSLWKNDDVVPLVDIWEENKISSFNDRAIPLKTYFPEKYKQELLAYEQSEICQNAKRRVEALSHKDLSVDQRKGYTYKQVEIESLSEIMTVLEDEKQKYFLNEDNPYQDAPF